MFTKNRTVQEIGNGQSVIRNVCPFCGKGNKVVVLNSDLQKYKNGALIQNAFPHLSASERELIMTGICDDCFPS